MRYIAGGSTSRECAWREKSKLEAGNQRRVRAGAGARGEDAIGVARAVGAPRQTVTLRDVLTRRDRPLRDREGGRQARLGAAELSRLYGAARGPRGTLYDTVWTSSECACGSSASSACDTAEVHVCGCWGSWVVQPKPGGAPGARADASGVAQAHMAALKNATRGNGRSSSDESESPSAHPGRLGRERRNAVVRFTQWHSCR